MFTLNREVQVSYFGAAVRCESKQFCLYSLTADDEWAGRMNRRSVISTLSYRSVLHHTRTDEEGEKGGGVRRRAVTRCTTHHLHQAADLLN